MRAEKRCSSLSISLSSQEVEILLADKIVGERVGITTPDAKVEIIPLSLRGEDPTKAYQFAEDRLQRAIDAVLQGEISGNGDLSIIVPFIALSDCRVSRLYLPFHSIMAPTIANPSNYIASLIPKGGVYLLLGGSLQTVNVDDYYPTAIE
jgi:hypothetical protein